MCLGQSAYTGVMASVFKQQPASPKVAGRQRDDLDRLLDPAVFKALSDPTRARLVSCLIKCNRPCSVTEVAECCSLDFSMVARHLGALARVGVLSSKKEGRTVWYTAQSPKLAAQFRALSEAIEAWEKAGCCGEKGCGDGGC